MSKNEFDFIYKTFNCYAQNKGLEIHLFNIDWYNAIVGPKFFLNYPANTLACLVISQPSMFEKAFIPFIKNHWPSEDKFSLELEDKENEPIKSNSFPDPLDTCMKLVFNDMAKLLPDHEMDIIHDFDMTYMRRPKILMQTAGHVAGAVYMYRKEDLYTTAQRTDPAANSPEQVEDSWMEGKKIFPVCLHPQYGGWFALRGVIIFKGISCVSLEKPVPREILQSKEQIKELLELYNHHWKNNAFRDVITATEKYSTLQQKYFSTPPADRVQFLKCIINEC